MKPRPLNDKHHGLNHEDLTEAMNRFRESISNGISVLVLKHGYSRARATDLILEQIRQSDGLPCEDEVFRVMHHLGLGIEAATQSIIVAKALKRVQEEQSCTKAKAINYLSSCLTTMKLLGSAEKTAAVQESPLGSSSTPIETPSPSVPSNTESDDCIKLCSAQKSNYNSVPPRPKTATRRSSSKCNLKSIKSRQPKPQQRKRSKDDESPSHDEKNPAQVDVEKALLVKEHEVQTRASTGHCKTPSPNVARHAGKRVNTHSREHDLEAPTQQNKRQRLDSI